MGLGFVALIFGRLFGVPALLDASLPSELDRLAAAMMKIFKIEENWLLKRKWSGVCRLEN